MLTLPSSVRIYVAAEAVELRRGFDGLAATTRGVIRQDPLKPAWLRDLAVAHATEVLRVEVTRAGLRHLKGGVPDWKRWLLARAVRRAAARRRRRKSNGPRRAP